MESGYQNTHTRCSLVSNQLQCSLAVHKLILEPETCQNPIERMSMASFGWRQESKFRYQWLVPQKQRNAINTQKKTSENLPWQSESRPKCFSKNFFLVQKSLIKMLFRILWKTVLYRAAAKCFFQNVGNSSDPIN